MEMRDTLQKLLWTRCQLVFEHEAGAEKPGAIFSTSLPPLWRRSDGEFKAVDTMCYASLNAAFSAKTATANLSTPLSQ